jgi:hypothetical protein
MRTTPVKAHTRTHTFKDATLKREETSVPYDSDEKIVWLKEHLPHGSGINGDWNIYYDNDGTIHADNFYEPMNDNGFYESPVQFSVRIPPDHFSGFTLTFTGGRHEKYMVEKYGLRDYLEETFAPTFEDDL